MKVSCPICKQWIPWENNPYRPFCSERCRLLDLGKWAGEEYRVPEEEDSSKGKKDNGKEE